MVTAETAEAGTHTVEARPIPAPTQAGESVRFDAIQGLRALAALAIFFTHVSETRYGLTFGYVAVGADRYVRAFFDELVVGVPIFFAISGFVMYRPFVARHAGGSSEPTTTSYLSRRFLRIYPAYWAALIGTVLVFRDEVVLHGVGHWAANLGLVQMYIPGTQGHGNVFEGMIQAWTLSAEITFYVTLPIFAFLVRRAGRGDVLQSHWTGVGMVMAVGVAARAWLVWGTPPTWVVVLPVYLPFFAIGMGLAVASVTAARGRAAPRVLEWLSRHAGLCFVVVALAYVVDTIVTDITDGAVISLLRPPSWVLLVRFLLQWVVAAGLLLPAVLGLSHGGRGRALLSCRLAVFLGAISYGIYLWHWAIIRWLGGHWFNASSGATMLKVTVVGLPVTIAIAYASYRLVEKPAINLSRKVR